MITNGAKPGRLGLALIASLGVNLLLVGVIVGGMGPMVLFGPRGPGGPGGPGDPGRGPERMIERMAERLEPRDAEIVRAAVRERGDRFRREEPRFREFPQRIREALSAEPFDPEALRRVLGEADAREAQFRAEVRDTAVRVATEISPASRKIIAETRPGEPPPRPNDPGERPDGPGRPGEK